MFSQKSPQEVSQQVRRKTCHHTFLPRCGTQLLLLPLTPPPGPPPTPTPSQNLHVSPLVFSGSYLRISGQASFSDEPHASAAAAAGRGPSELPPPSCSSHPPLHRSRPSPSLPPSPPLVLSPGRTNTGTTSMMPSSSDGRSSAAQLEYGITSAAATSTRAPRQRAAAGLTAEEDPKARQPLLLLHIVLKPGSKQTEKNNNLKSCAAAVVRLCLLPTTVVLMMEMRNAAALLSAYCIMIHTVCFSGNK